MTGNHHQQVLGNLVAKFRNEVHVVGIMLQGSVARGDHLPGSDLDLLVLVEPGHDQGLVSEEVDEVFVELHYRDEHILLEKLQRRPMLAFGFQTGTILHDPHGRLSELKLYARRLLAEYETPQELRDEIRYWLFSTRIKLVAAEVAGDELKAAFLAATTTWKILEGLWAVNDLPIPNGGAVLAHLDDLALVPDGLVSKLNTLLLGGAMQRAEAGVLLIDWLLEKLADKGGQGT